MTEAEQDRQFFEDVTRRRLMKQFAAVGAATAGAGVLAACAGDDEDSGGTDTVGTGVAKGGKRGGTLRAGLIGGSTADTLDPLRGVTTTDFARNIQLYDQLSILDPDGSIGMKLAEEMTANSDATEWTIRLKPDITFHDGKPLTADDVIYTFKQILNPKNPTNSTAQMAPFDPKRLRKVDKLTVKLGCKQPFSTFVDTASSLSTMGIIPVGFDPKNPVGTGPFKFQSFTPGRQSVFVRNPDYWQEGVPYLDKLVIANYKDETSQINALRAEQVDVIDQLSATSVATLPDSQTVISQSGGFNPFTMRMDVAPFDDVNVRQALRFLVDREQMNQQVFSGHALIGNDLWSPFDPGYDKSLPKREQDIEQAKSLLKQAGRSDLSIELITSDIAQGVVKSAEVFVQQAKAAGVQVRLRKVTVAEFFGPNFKKWPFAQDYWFYLRYFCQVASAMIPDAPFGETHFEDAEYMRLYNEALRTIDEDKRNEISKEMQRIDYERGTYIIPMFAPIIDGHAPQVKGIHTSRTGQSLGNYDFKNMWLET